MTPQNLVFILSLLIFCGCKTSPKESNVKDVSSHETATSIQIEGVGTGLTGMPFQEALSVSLAGEQFPFVGLDFSGSDQAQKFQYNRMLRVTGTLTHVSLNEQIQLPVLGSISRLEVVVAEKPTMADCKAVWNSPEFRHRLNNTLALTNVQSPLPDYRLSYSDGAGLVLLGSKNKPGCASLIRKGQVIDQFIWDTPPPSGSFAWLGPYDGEVLTKNQLKYADVVDSKETFNEGDYYYLFHEIFHAFQRSLEKDGKWVLSRNQAVLEKAYDLCFGDASRSVLWTELHELVIATQYANSGDLVNARAGIGRFLAARAKRRANTRDVLVPVNGTGSQLLRCPTIEAYQEKVEGSAEFISQSMVNMALNRSKDHWIKEMLSDLKDSPSADWSTNNIWYRLGGMQFALISLLSNGDFPQAFERIAATDVQGDSNPLTEALCKIAAVNPCQYQ